MAFYCAALLLCTLLSAGAQQAPVVTIEPRSASVRQGETVSFRCRVQGGVQPVQLEWKRTNNQPLSDNVKIGPDGSVITFTSTRPGNQGTYRCLATSAQGRAQSVATLNVRQPPKVRVTPSGPVQVQAGEQVSVECHVTGRPRPSASWLRVDRNRETVLSTTTSTDAATVMQVVSARSEDAGVYICRAQNSEGTSESKVELRVEGGVQGATLPEASVSPAETVAVEGQTVTLHCEVSGFPTPTISWSKLRAPLPWLHKIQGGSLTLQNVGRQDSGQYICNATNDVGFIEATAQVEVETRPYTTCLPEQLRVRAGESIRLQCLVHGTPPVHLQWSKVGGTIPRRAETHDSILLISQAKAADAGTYKCVASNRHGTSEAVAKVTVR
ncbi:secreted immunoglobulin domain 4 [Scleropages formosus]|uniref:Basement membrane-specific heparan sulfate proteoglycan core protein-like n=1 Tax=Scleropages formosus TaxID=113540 RepID=A0A8C9SJ82_SCLFO|nr:basement membrane-specific heparan sulfate proteoglycan core protein-like [Scleropages formosus]